MIPDQVINDLRSFNWQNVLNFSASLSDLNDRQWRFLKGLCIELATEKHSKELVYVGDTHKDFDWPKYQLTVELKSIVSMSMYTKKGRIRKQFHVILNNSMGTNISKTLSPENVADILIVVCNNGVFAIARDTVIKNSRYSGDGWGVSIRANDVVELSNHIQPVPNNQIQIKSAVTAAIRSILETV